MIKKLLIVLLVNALAFPLLGKELVYQLKLDGIQKVSPIDNGTEDIYLNVDVFENQQHIAIHRIPDYPMHWEAKFLNRISNVLLSKGTLSASKPIKLQIEVAKQNDEPVIVDDLIGLITVAIEVKDGKTFVGAVEKNAQMSMSKVENGFKELNVPLKGKYGFYKLQLGFKVEQKKSTLLRK